MKHLFKVVYGATTNIVVDINNTLIFFKRHHESEPQAIRLRMKTYIMLVKNEVIVDSQEYTDKILNTIQESFERNFKQFASKVFGTLLANTTPKIIQKQSSKWIKQQQGVSSICTPNKH